METGSDWLILSCPACEGLLRMSRWDDPVAVRCPTCQHVLDPDAVRLAVATSPSSLPSAPALPTQRTYNPDAFVLRKGHEDWQFRPAGPRVPQFTDRIGKTEDPEHKVTGLEPARIRIDWHRVKHGDELILWDTEKAEPPPPTPAKRLAVAAGLFVLVCAAVAAMVIQTYTRRPRADLSSVPEVLELPTDPLNLELTMNRDMADTIWNVVQRFAACRDTRSLLRMIRDPDRVAPLMEEWYKDNPSWEPFRIRRKTEVGDFTASKRFVVVPVETVEYQKLVIALERTSDGFLVDWESFAGYSDLSWDKLKSQRPKEPVLLRAVVRYSDYYNRDFPSRSAHGCYQLSDKDESRTLYGYVPMGTDLNKRILGIVASNPFMHLVLKVKYPEHSTDSRQLEIVELVQRGWILRGEPDSPEPTRVEPLDIPTELRGKLGSDEGQPGPGSSPHPEPGDDPALRTGPFGGPGPIRIRGSVRIPGGRP